MTSARPLETIQNLATRISGARPGQLSDAPQPELAKLVDRPPEGDEWLHEIKLDGYRAFCRIEGGAARLISRRGLALTDSFPRVATAAAKLPVRTALLDGEVAVLVPEGRTSFHALQNATGGRTTGELVYFAFDLLHLDGTNLCNATLDDRKRVLQRLVPAKGIVRYTPHIIGGGPEMFANACKLGLEGIISKRRDAPYRGGRSRCWLKSKCTYQQEFVVVGYTTSDAGASFGALLLGVHDERGQLIYVGRAGTGFSGRELIEIGRALKKMERKDPAFAGRRPGPARVMRWVEPMLVVEVRFMEWTEDGCLRHPSFLGVRLDKHPKDVVRERPG
jgi:bifunctional non-homologous end joining protein LigD